MSEMPQERLKRAAEEWGDEALLPKGVREAIRAVLAESKTEQEFTNKYIKRLHTAEAEVKARTRLFAQQTIERVRAEARAEKAEAALRELTGWAGDLVQAWEAHRKLQAGFGGMGHNILVEEAGKYGSMTYWNRLAKAVEQARAALCEAPREGEP
jgi:DNA primase